MNQPPTVTPQRSRARAMHLAPRRAAIPALRLPGTCAVAVDPVTALSVGLNVDAHTLPAAAVDGIRNESIDLTRPATTIALLELNAVAWCPPA